jgi:hypothetical protein
MDKNKKKKKVPGDSTGAKHQSPYKSGQSDSKTSQTEDAFAKGAAKKKGASRKG